MPRVAVVVSCARRCVRSVLHVDAEAGSQCGETGVVALADRPQAPRFAAQVDLEQEKCAFGRRRIERCSGDRGSIGARGCFDFYGTQVGESGLGLVQGSREDDAAAVTGDGVETKRDQLLVRAVGGEEDALVLRLVVEDEILVGRNAVRFAENEGDEVDLPGDALGPRELERPLVT
ncbi:Uncharacterised protein [Mycobacteroides abscessus subsp. abscessus]|nr:Uncharacterised protein [Mycobacteroides abscessus subsp. abscessus]